MCCKLKRSTLGIAAALFCSIFIAIAAWMDETRPFTEPMLSFRFDDAFTSQVPALSYLTERKIVGTVYVITGHAGLASYMSWEEIRKLQSAGHEIGSHSVSHLMIPFLSKKDRQYQLKESRSTLESHGIRVMSFSWPYGMRGVCASPEVRRYYRNAVDYPWIRSGSLNGKNRDHYSIQCISPKKIDEFSTMLNIAIKRNLWMTACFHRFGEDVGRYSVSMKEFAAMVHYAADLRDRGKIKILTVSEGARKLD